MEAHDSRWSRSIWHTSRVCGAKTLGGDSGQKKGYLTRRRIKYDEYNSVLPIRATTLTRKTQFFKIAKCGCPGTGRAAGTCAKCLDRVVPGIACVLFLEDCSPMKIAFWREMVTFWRETVTFCVSVAPPMGQSESAFGDLSTLRPLTCE